MKCQLTTANSTVAAAGRRGLLDGVRQRPAIERVIEGQPGRIAFGKDLDFVLTWLNRGGVLWQLGSDVDTVGVVQHVTVRIAGRVIDAVELEQRTGPLIDSQPVLAGETAELADVGVGNDTFGAVVVGDTEHPRTFAAAVQRVEESARALCFVASRQCT